MENAPIGKRRGDNDSMPSDENKRLRQEVREKFRNYREKAKVNAPVDVVFDKRGKLLAHVKCEGSTGKLSMHVNIKELETLTHLDSASTKTFLNFGMAHEVAHLQQYEEKGLTDPDIDKRRRCALITNSWIQKQVDESDANKRATRLSGISEAEADRAIDILSARAREKFGIKPMKPKVPGEQLMVMGKPAARIIGWMRKGKDVIPAKRAMAEDVPKSADEVYIVQFDTSGHPIPKTSKFVKRHELDDYSVVG
jgi:hypothetical protein